ncbi:MAG TPA: bifunctional diaminohydroxyphosphoribosylaminopyrimidine deaminase/5-amino-6-(5-phosphoribosylamino)uracil reductase RibD [Actinomycetes bacterium]|nr:bifunctional diaminohydroxyphosphoribosylaminopyrimidine deaminase/5-amino-6-(5-phosphoribosylamino)uracil reductase RibD [Actinomycetes bacterium]
MAAERQSDEAWMARAVALAEGGRGTTGPNPMVGAVLVRDGRVVGEGFHLAAGQPHAETLALAAAGPLAAGATCYVTLEPCAHQGRTPPCVDALLAAGVARVVVAVPDPDPRVAGAGLARLAAAGVQVTVGAGADAAADQNAAYLTHRRLGRPRITLKAAASLDGKVAAPDGTSQWITGPAARSDAHRLRAEADAVCVGAGTAMADDPRLTVRLDGYAGRQPLRVLVDATGRVGADGRLFDGEAATLVATTATASAAAFDAWKAAGAEVLVCPQADRAPAAPRVARGVDLGHLAGLLGERGVLELLVEGGPRLQASFWAAGLADRLIWYLAPLVIGGDGAPGLLGGDGAATLAAAGRLRLASVDRLGDDLRLVAYPRPTGEAAGAPPDPPRPELAERGR